MNGPLGRVVSLKPLWAFIIELISMSSNSLLTWVSMHAHVQVKSKASRNELSSNPLQHQIQARATQK
jgi:hypothetical protein